MGEIVPRKDYRAIYIRTMLLYKLAESVEMCLLKHIRLFMRVILTEDLTLC